MRDLHHRVRVAGYSGDVSGEVLAFPQAPDGVEVRHLRAFVAVAEELNFSRAATRLYLSQPALSRQIRALERLMGCELLRRSTHRVELTVAGSALLDRARRLLADLDEAIAATQSVGGELANRMATHVGAGPGARRRPIPTSRRCASPTRRSWPNPPVPEESACAR